MDKILFFPLIALEKGIDAFSGGLDKASKGAGVGGDGNVGTFVGILVTAVLQILGVIFLVLIIYGGFKWMSAAGQDEKLKEAQRMITNSVVGLIIVVLAYAISTFVLEKLTEAI